MSLRILETVARDVRTFPRDAALAYRADGLGGIWRTFAERSVYRVASHGHLLVIAQSLDSFREVPPPAGVRIAQATDSDWGKVEAVTTQSTIDRHRRRRSQGHTCLVAWRGHRAIGYTWFAGRVGPDLLPYPIDFPPEAAYLFDLYVVPAERANGVGSALVSARLSLARERGHREAWRMISPQNRASLRTLEKTTAGGTRIVGELRWVKLFGRTYGRFRPWPASSASSPESPQ